MKVTGGDTTLHGGVSKLPAYQQRPGQCQEQMNFLSDPGVGLARRPGSVRLGERGLGIRDAAEYVDGEGWSAVPWRTPTRNLTALVRKSARAGGATNAPIQVFDHGTNTFLNLNIPATDALFAALSEGGVSSCVPVGEYLLLAGNTVTVPHTDTDAEAALSTQSAVWVRGGDYDRTYTITARLGTVEKSVSYRTPPAAYPGQLDTTNIPWYIRDHTGGTEAVTYPVTVLETADACQIRLPQWGYPGEAIITGLTITDDQGNNLVDIGAGTITSELQYGQALLVSPRIRLHEKALGRRYTVKYTIQHIGIVDFLGTVRVDTSLIAYAGFGKLGVAFLPTPMVGGVTIPGFTETIYGPNTSPIPAGQFYYNPAYSPNYVYFSGADAGKNLTISGTRDKVLANPDYARAVADAEAAYQRKVTQWALDAAEKIQPAAIAGELNARLTSAGATSWQYGTHIAVVADTVVAGDGKDGTLIRAVDREVGSTEDLTDKHHVGKIVHIRPAGASAGYYVRAEAKQEGQTGFVEVRWVEGTPAVRQITGGIALCTTSGQEAYAAGTTRFERE